VHCPTVARAVELLVCCEDRSLVSPWCGLRRIRPRGSSVHSLAVSCEELGACCIDGQSRARDHARVTELAVCLRTFTRVELAIVAPWFRDPHTRRFLGASEWPMAMLERDVRVVGEAFRGAVQTGAYRYLAHAAGRPVGYIDCGTFDRCTVYGGEGPGGPIITDSIDVATASIAFVIDPNNRRRGLGRAMIIALMRQPELRLIELFEAGVEPENVASRRCLKGAGFRLDSEQPDCEGMLYYRAWRADVDPSATLSA
jgi:RimJ/RimL family protein N-acetyltransferase